MAFHFTAWGERQHRGQRAQPTSTRNAAASRACYTRGLRGALHQRAPGQGRGFCRALKRAARSLGMSSRPSCRCVQTEGSAPFLPQTNTNHHHHHHRQGKARLCWESKHVTPLSGRGAFSQATSSSLTALSPTAACGQHRGEQKGRKKTHRRNESLRQARSPRPPPATTVLQAPAGRGGGGVPAAARGLAAPSCGARRCRALVRGWGQDRDPRGARRDRSEGQLAATPPLRKQFGQRVCSVRCWGSQGAHAAAGRGGTAPSRSPLVPLVRLFVL